MKFLLTLLLCASIAYGQTIITQPYAFQKYITVKDSSNLQGRLTIPTDTTTNKNGIAQIGTSIYTGNGTYWTLASGGSSSSFNNGGNSFGSTAIIGTKDNNDLKIINNNTNYWTFGKTGTLSNSGVSFDFAGDVTASSSAAITGGAIYPINYLSLPDTNRNVAYNLIGTHNGSLFAQIGSGQYFRQVLMAKDSSLYVTPTQLTAASYTLPQATSSVLGGVKIGSNINVSSGTISLNNSNVIAALGYMPIQLSSLSATRNVSSGSIFSYNNLTGAYNFDTTKLLTLTSISATTPMTFNTSTGVIAIGQSSTSTNGYLSSTDWNTFNGKINLSSLSATRNVSTGSIFTYNSSTGAYNLDTTKLGGGGITGNGTPSGQLMPFSTWSTANSKLSSSTVSYGNYDSTNHNFNFGTTTPQSTYLLNVNGAAAATTLNGLTLSQLGASSNLYMGNLNGGNGGAAGTYNMSIGYGGMRTTNSSSQYNIGIGANNFYNLTSGTNNVSIMPNNGAYNLTTGVDNTFINSGPASNVSYSTGIGGSINANYATAIGWNSYSTLNGVSLGYNAGYNSSGNYTNINNNVFVGYEAGLSSIAANNTIIIGNYGNSPTAYASTYNTFIGNSQNLYNVGSYNTVIGAQIQPRTNGSNEVILGDGAGNQRLNIFSTGNAMLGYGNNPTDDATNKLQVNGSIKATQYRLSALNTAPASSSDTGTTGEIRITASYIYICTATNTWVRAALSTW